jgi:multidrug efflux pump subunit AcrA (membrane-fusion protein)
MSHHRTTTVTGILLAAAILLSACSFSLPGAKPAAATTPTVAYSAANDNSVVIAEGRLIPNQSAGLAFLAGGRIEQLSVVEGSDVSAGQVIAHLEGAEQIQASLEAARFELLSAQQAINDLHDNYASVLADAQQKLAQAKIDLKDRQDDRTRMVYRRASEATLNGLRADVLMAEDELDKAQNFYDHHQYSEELVRAQALSMLSAAQKARDRAKYNLEYASDLPDKNEIDKAEAKVQAAMAQVDSARLSLDRLASGPDTQLLALAQARLLKAQTGVKAAQASLDNLDLKAPFTGKIVDLNVTQGEEVTPGETIATLADFSRWLVETDDLTELKVVHIQVGQKASLVADALPEVTLNGTVDRISNKYEEKQGDITYTVRVVLDQSDARLRWGMTFAVTLDTSAAGNASAAATAAQPTLAPTSAVSPTAAGPDDATQAQAALLAYFTALDKQDAQGAASLVSNYSLIAEQTTRAAAAEAIQAQISQGTRWAKAEIKESKAQDSQTMLVRVSYELTTKDAKTSAETKTNPDEWWPVRSEDGRWEPNWARVIDYRGVDIPGQTINGLSVHPVQLTRYPDRLRLVLFVQNNSSDPIVLGQPNEIMAVFTLGEKTIDAEHNPLAFDRKKTYPDAVIEIKGDLLPYPDKVEIRKWKNYQTAPWFTFIFSTPK